MSKQYGMELILDLSKCNPEIFTRTKIHEFFKEVAKITKMRLALSPFFWDEENGEKYEEPHLKGISAVHFVETSSLVVHTLTLLKSVFINIFTCKIFEPDEVCKFAKEFFEGKIVNSQVVLRKFEK